MSLDQEDAIKVVVTRIDDVIVQPSDEEVLGMLLPVQLANIPGYNSDVVVVEGKF